MFISLHIANVDKLPGGGPMSYQTFDRDFEIGRENRDWILPDPDRFISGRHCQIRYEGGTFWLYDVSRNGTFVNGSTERVASPYRLGHGDRLRIGRYIITVSIADEEPESVAAGNLESEQRKPARQATNAQGGLGAPEFTRPSTSDLERREMPAAASQSPESRDHFSFTSDPFLSPETGPRDPGQGRPLDASPLSGVPTPPPKPATLPPGRDEMLRSIAIGAGVSPEMFLQREPQEVATEIGGFLRTVVDELVLLLKARAAAKALAKSSHRTMINPADNNPLKFVPRSEEILEIMFAKRRAGYLDARHSVEEAFRDLKTHELATYAAMQAALSRLLDDLSPDAIERKVPASSFGSRKSRSWDAFVATWEAKEAPHENGMLDLFLAYFAEAYAKTAKDSSEGSTPA